MKTAYSVSDIHMFCRRSRWQRHLDALHEAADAADLFVFNGDTFDFKWSTLENRAATLEAAIAFLRDFSATHTHCRIHLNLGNHDHVGVFIEALDTLAEATPNFTWDPYHLRIDNMLFLHGDVTSGFTTQARLASYRAMHLDRKQVGAVKNAIWDAAFKVRAHVHISHLLFSHRRTVRCLTRYLEDLDHGVSKGVERVYFGHTHIVMDGHSRHGITFHNGGAPFPGVDFCLTPIEY